MWCLGTWFSVVLGSVRLMVGFDDPKSLLQPKQFCDSNQSNQVSICRDVPGLRTFSATGEQKQTHSKTGFFEQGALHSSWPCQVRAPSL